MNITNNTKQTLEVKIDGAIFPLKNGYCLNLYDSINSISIDEVKQK